jgi:NTP pyrophosphatase (non-canonical NTP hydrolase)
MDKQTLDIRLAVAKVKKWGWTVGITGDEGKGTPSRQYRKLLEEVGELGEALIVNDKDETIDAIGDCAVVLILLAELKGLKFEDCLSSAYGVIEARIGKGKMVNGEFKKDS